MNLDDFCAKVEFHDDVIEALDNGLRSSDIDADEDPVAHDLKEIWIALEASYEVFNRLVNEAQQIVDRVLDGLEEE